MYTSIPLDSGAHKTCGVDYLECSGWPTSREVCWHEMLEEIHGAMAHVGNGSFLRTAPELKQLFFASEPLEEEGGGRQQQQRFTAFLYAQTDMRLNSCTLAAGILSQDAANADSLWFPRHRCPGPFARSTMTHAAALSLE